MNYCGLDVHKDSIFACTIDKEGKRHHRQFLTTTPSIKEMIAWLQQLEVKYIALESTASYWVGIWLLLEPHFELTLVNPYFIKQMPGKKSDVKDAEWIATLHQGCFLKKSLVPTQLVRELRGYLRQRVKYVNLQTRIIQEIDWVLMEGNLRLGSLTSIKSVTAMSIIRAISRGESDPNKLQEHVHKSILKKRGDCYVRDCLTGNISPYMIEMVKMHLETYEHYQSQMTKLEESIQSTVDHYYSGEVELLQTIPGIEKLAAITILAEMGGDVKAFETPEKLCSWAGMCARNDVSANKVKSKKITKGNAYLRRTLAQCAYGASRTKGTFLQKKYHVLQKRMHRNKAAVAISRKILCVVWHVLMERQEYKSPKVEPDTRRTKRQIAYHKKQYEDLLAQQLARENAAKTNAEKVLVTT
jgi:transposase